MSNLALGKYPPLINRIEKESGNISSPIWLLVNPKYPTVIYNIWNPILYEIQDEVYRKLHARIDPGNIYIKTTVSDIDIDPNTSDSWSSEVAKQIVMLRENVLVYQPKILITFGTITYEYVRRVFDIKHEKGSKYWSTKLGDEFERSITDFDINQTNRIPLLSRVMKSGKFFEEDSEKYFRDVGKKIADRIIENKDRLKIWT